MTIEWRMTAGGVEIAEYEDMTCVVYQSGWVEIMKGGAWFHERDLHNTNAAKQWFEREYRQPKYTVTKYGDGGEVYASNDGKRVAMVTVLCGAWSLDRGDGHCKTGICEYELAKIEAIAYVTGKDS